MNNHIWIQNIKYNTSEELICKNCKSMKVIYNVNATLGTVYYLYNLLFYGHTEPDCNKIIIESILK